MITIRALGPVTVALDDGPVPPELLWRKNLALLVYLARSPRRTRSREHLMALLWGDKPGTSARHSLREAIRAVRSAAGAGLVEAEGDQVRILDGAIELDADRFDACVAAQDWAGAAALATGELLEGFGVPDAQEFEDWLAVERASLLRREVEALVRHADALQRAGDLSGSTEAARRAQALDSSSSGATQALMMAAALRGERAEALAVYEAWAARTGAGADDPAGRLAEQIRKGRVWQRRKGPASKGAESRRAPLAGRERELGALLDAWHVARGGRAALALIEGSAGTGRTRLLEELVGRARLEGAAVADARATPADRADAWSAAFALARGGLLAAGGLAASPAEALATFAARIEDWADRFPAARGAAAREPGAALVDVVRAVAADQPVVLAIDDAQWLDDDSLRGMHAVLRDLAGRPVLVAMTTLAHPPREDMDRLRSRIGRDIAGTAVTLEALAPAAIRRLVAWAMPTYGDADADRLARRLAADSAGLPLLAVELLHAVALGLDLGDAQPWPAPMRTLDQTRPGDLPPALVAAIRIGFRRLSRDAQAAVAAAAVLDDRADAPRLGRATGLEARALADALDEAEWERWIAADGRGYTFVARLARDVVKTDLVTEGQRRRILELA